MAFASLNQSQSMRLIPDERTKRFHVRLLHFYDNRYFFNRLTKSSACSSSTARMSSSIRRVVGSESPMY